MNNNYNRGSEWRKWDLHIHTPCSIEQEYGGDTNENWEKFISDLERLPTEIKVIGINDYIFIDGYKKVLEEKQKGRLNNIDLILPVIELRIDKFANLSQGEPFKRVNFHIIFSNELTPEQIEAQFLSSLSAEYKIDPECESNSDWGGVITRENLINLGNKLIQSSSGKLSGSPLKIGFNSLNIPYERLLEKLKNNPILRNKYLTAVGKTEWDTMRWDGSPAEKKSVINNANFIFSASPTVDLAIKAKETLKNQGVNYKLLHCSDAHRFINDLQNTKEKELGHCFTWIKADPTFEGLKQIIYEPEERVRIQENNPELDYNKPFFSSIKFNNDEKIFDDDELSFDQSTQEIPLNPNLITIIGGRGEGKSMLMKYIATSFDIQTIEKGDNFLKNGNIEVIHSKTIKDKEQIISFPIIKNEKHALDFIYISQGELKNIVEKPTQLANGISEMANISEKIFDRNLDKEILDKVTELHSLTDFLDKEENKLENLQAKEKKQQGFINNITTRENKEKLEQYSEILKKINTETERKNQLLTLQDSFTQKVKELNQSINSVNENYTFDIPTIEVEQVFKPQLKKIKEFISTIETNLSSLEEQKESIKEEFGEFYTGDLSTLLKDVDKYQNELSITLKKIKEIEEKESRKEELKKNIFEDAEESLSLVSKIKEEYNKQYKAILEDWNTFKNIEQREDFNPQQKKIMQSLLADLDVDVKIDFDKDVFYNELRSCINGAEWRVKNNQKAQEGYFKIVDSVTYFTFIKEKYLEAYYADGIYGNTLKDILFNEEYRKKYIKVYPILKYKGKDLNKISVGQKGTVYLKMKLATEAFSKPIIFDQPEDDLDNQFIIKELVDLFKELKKYRQIIIITHNANLVVNADAEQVIVAKNDNEKLKYTSGSLENPTINKGICEILEGGEQAFKNREKKYGFN